MKTRAGIESEIHGSAGVELCDTIARHAIDVFEETSNHDSSIRVQPDGVYLRVDDQCLHPCARIKGGIERAIGLQSRNATAANPIKLAKESSDHDSAIRLNDHGVDIVIGACSGIECRVHRAIGIQPRDSVARDAIELGKRSCNDNSAIRLARNCSDRIIRTRTGIETRIEETRLGQRHNVNQQKGGEGAATNRRRRTVTTNVQLRFHAFSFFFSDQGSGISNPTADDRIFENSRE